MVRTYYIKSINTRASDCPKLKETPSFVPAAPLTSDDTASLTPDVLKKAILLARP